MECPFRSGQYSTPFLTLSPPIPLRIYTLPYWSNPPLLIFDIRALNPSNSSNLEQLASKGLNLEQCQAAGLLTAHLQTQSTDSGGVTAYSFLLSTPPHSHWVLISPRAFAVPRVVEGVDLGTAVGVCSRLPRLCITVAYAINTQLSTAGFGFFFHSVRLRISRPGLYGSA